LAVKDNTAENEKLLWKQIKNGEIGSLYLFYGPEEYLIRNYTGHIEKALLSKDFALLNKVVLEGKAAPSAIIDNCRTSPVFSDRKLVIVKNSGLFKGSKKSDASGSPGSSGKHMDDAESEQKAQKAGKKAKDDGRRKSDELPDFLQQVPEHVCLIFIEAEIDKRLKIVDLIKSNGLVVEFDYKKPNELTDWVVKRMRELGYETDARTAAMIVEYCESGMDDILNEVKKLCAYAGDRIKITESDVAKVCTKSVKSRVFDLTDAIGAKQTAKALSLLNDMDVLKEPMPKIMYMIARQFRQLVQVKLLMGDGANQAKIASHFKVPPFIAGKLMEQAKRFSMDKLEQAIATGLELDLAVKTGQMRDKAAIELMITSLST